MVALHPLHKELPDLLRTEPGIVMKWIQRAVEQGVPTTALPPEVYKGLISYLLRSPVALESSNVFKCLKKAMTFPLQDSSRPLQKLGFTSTQGPNFRKVLGELLSSGIKNEALHVDGEVLRFYSAAGAGSDDEDEYHDAVKKGYLSLDEIRRGNRHLVMECFAMVLREMTTSVLAEGSRDFMAQLRKTLFTHLPNACRVMNDAQLSPVVGVFCAVIRLEQGSERRAYRLEMRTMLHGLSRREDGRELRLIAVQLVKGLPRDVQTAALECLELYVCRDEVKGMKAGKMCADIYVDSVLPAVLGRHMDKYAKRCVPELLVAMTRAWMQETEAKDFAFKGCREWSKKQKETKMLEVTSLVIALLESLHEQIGKSNVSTFLVVSTVVKLTIYRIFTTSEMN